MSFHITMSQVFDPESGSSPADARSRSFEGLTKHEVQQVEREFIHGVFLEFGKASMAATEGKAPRMGATNPQTCTFSYSVLEDGKLWSAMTCTWPKWGMEAQAMFDGAIAGIVARLAHVAKKETHRGGGKR